MNINSILKVLLKSVFSLVLLANVGYGATTLKVNWSGPGESCDNLLTLAEAAHLGRGGFPRALTNAERNQISGGTFVPAPLPPECAGAGWAVVDGLGANFADDIIFVNDITASINYGIRLGKNDDIDGTTGNLKVILDGTGQAAGTWGIQIEDNSGSQVRNLIIRNFPSAGIFAQRMNGAKFEGLDIFGNGANGISMGFNGNVNSRSVTIGGTQPQHRNRIFSNAGDGIFIAADPAHDRFPDQSIFILNNLIGTGDGLTDSGNGGRGISLINAFGVIIGDSTGLTRNIISGNNNDGIALEGAGAISNIIIGNFIGTTESSGAPLGNTASGIVLLNDTGSTADFISTGPKRIGRPGLGNVISANNFGIFIADPNTSKNRVQANLIGTNVGGNTDLGNAADGIYIVNGTFDNIIGGTNSGEGNLIAFNRNGIRADSGLRNVFQRNRIFSNDLLGIDLAPVGVTTNDPGDGDAGPNNLQNFPVITYINAQANVVTLEGTFNSAPNQTYTLEFFGNSSVDASGFGEGRNFLGTILATTNAGGNATFNQTFSVSLSTTGTWVTATATDANNNTSEFSPSRNICADLRLSPASILAPLGGIVSSFTFTRATGCSAPTAVSNSAWITVGSVGAGTVNFTVAANNMPPRDGLINLNYNNGSGQSTSSFLVSQNNGCSYSINPTSQNISAAGGGSTVNVVSGCTWFATSNAAWITITGTGSGAVSFNVAPNTGPARSGTLTVAGQTFTVNQANGCAYSANPLTINFPASGGSSSISITAPTGCAWTATPGASWVQVTSGASGSGNGTINFTVAANNGNSRSTLIGGVPNNFINISQITSCAWTTNPASTTLPASGGSGSFAVTTAANCNYTIQGNTWITITSQTNTTGNQTVTYTVAPNTGAVRNGLIQIFENISIGPITNFLISQGNRQKRFDFDGDGKTEVSIFRPSDGSWWYVRSSDSQNRVYSFGVATDKLAPADYTGDGKTDIAIWRPSNGNWFIQRSEDGSYFSFPFGQNGDIPCPADFDADGKADPCVFRPSNSTWYISRTSGGTSIVTFGASGDVPVVADYDGDGKADIAVFRPSGGSWWILRSSTGVTFSTSFGLGTDKPVAADYTGDGKADIAVWRPSNGNWFILRSEDNTYFSFPFGQNGDIPVAGDYDGDGKADTGVFRPSTATWYLNRTTAGSGIFTFGTPTDNPVPAAFVP